MNKVLWECAANFYGDKLAKEVKRFTSGFRGVRLSGTVQISDITNPNVAKAFEALCDVGIARRTAVGFEILDPGLISKLEAAMVRLVMSNATSVQKGLILEDDFGL